jgi:hypothetical protein
MAVIRFDQEMWICDVQATIECKGGGGSSSPPPAPDPVATANAQAAANKEAVRESALVNQVNQVTPQGNLTWTGEVGTPNRTVTQTLSPEGQQMLDLTNQAGIKYGETANQQLNAVSGKLAQPLDFSSLGAAPVANEQTRTATRDAILGRMQPQLEQDRNALETRLANQGIQMGSEAWKQGMDDQSRRVTDARLGADAQAGNEMSRVFGLESAARNQGLTEMVQQRQIPLNELAAMLSGSQVQAPNFVNPQQYNVPPADIMGATYANYQGQQNAAAQAAGSKSANQQGLYGLMGAGMMAGAMKWSDARLKRDIRQIGTLPNGMGVYAFRYLWSAAEEIGLMAQEVLRLKPDAVSRIGEFYAVDYRKALS